MISRVTLVSLLLALLLGSGLMLWNTRHPDACSRYVAGEIALPATTMVQMGANLVEVPCNQWYARQQTGVQGICILEAVFFGVFAVGAFGDFLTWMRRRRDGDRT